MFYLFVITSLSIAHSIELPGRQNETVGLDFLSLTLDDEVAVEAGLQEVPHILLQLGP